MEQRPRSCRTAGNDAREALGIYREDRPVRTKRSVCNRKARYGSADEALAFATRIALPLRPYRCDRCGQFHLTSRTKGKWMPQGEA